MPQTFTTTEQMPRHTDDMQDIITKVPSWILRWGVTFFFIVIILIIGLSALIRYPDIVPANLKITSPNSPKPIVAKIQGKLTTLLVKQNDRVFAGQALGYIESTANHTQVLDLLVNLTKLQNEAQINNSAIIGLLNDANNMHLGELQSSYQTFYQEYLSYRSSIGNGFFVKKRTYLDNDLSDLIKQEKQLQAQKMIQQRDYALSEQDFHVYQKLFQQKAETASELRDYESRYLAKKSQLVQTDAALITANTNFASKEKELLELNNQIAQEMLKFMQALNSLISQMQDWRSKYVLTASQSGRLEFANIIQENDVLAAGQEVFYINPGNEQFFGEMMVPQASMGKVKQGERVLIKLKSYPFEEYGMLKGTIQYISDVPYKDSVFLSRVNFNISKISDMKRPIHLKQGMMADAEIVTQDASILERICRNVIKVINNK